MAQLEIASARVALSASVAAFAKNMQDAKNHVKSNAKGMERAMDTVRKSFNATIQATKILGAAAIAGAGSLAYMVKRSIDAADNFGKLSKRLGASTEALSEYKHVAELSGVSFETLTMGWQRMTRRIAEAANGMGEARGALKELGLNAIQLAQMRPEEQFEILADALSKVGSDADRVRLAMKLFDSEGVSLIQTMGEGAKGLQEMRKEARELGLSLDEDTVKAAERFNDNLLRLKNTQIGFSNVVMEAVLPTLEQYTDSIVKSSKETEGMKKSSEVAATGLKLLLTAGTLLWTVLDQVGTALGGIAATATLLFKGEWKAAWESAGSVTNDFVNSLETNRDKIEAIWEDAANKVEAGADEKGKKLSSPASSANKYINEELDKMTNALESFYVASDEDIVADLNAHLARTSKAKEVAVDNDLTFFFNALDKQAEKHRETYEEMSEFEIQAYRNMESYAGQAFFDIMKGNYDNLLDSFIDMLQRMISEWMAAQAMIGLFGEGFGKGGPLGGLLGTAIKGLTGAISGASGGGWDFATWDSGGYIGMASGGIINEPVLGIGKSGQSYLFGESGPEMVTPAGAGGGGTVNININAVDAASFYQLANRNPGAIIGPLMNQMQKGNNSLRAIRRKTR